MTNNDSSLSGFLHALFETTADKVNALISGAAIASPLLNLKETSEAAALWLPILGCVWLGSQIVHKWWHWRYPPNGG